MMKRDEGKCPACGSDKYVKFDVQAVDGLTSLVYRGDHMGLVSGLVACAECGCVRFPEHDLNRVKEKINA